MHRHFATVCSRITRVSPRCSMQNLYQLVKYSLINSWNRIHVISGVTLHVNMRDLTVEDRLLIKTSQTEKGCIVENMIVKFSSRHWKWHTLFDLLRIIQSTCFTKAKRPIHTKRVYVRLRRSTRVDGRLRPSTRVDGRRRASTPIWNTC